MIEKVQIKKNCKLFFFLSHRVDLKNKMKNKYKQDLELKKAV